MSARKWPIYTMKVGEEFMAEKPPYCLRTKIYLYSVRSGKVFRTRRIVRTDPTSPIVVKRMA